MYVKINFLTHDSVPQSQSSSFICLTINMIFLQEYAFLEETLADRMTKSTLIIRKSESRHFGSYNCTVTNLYGMDSIEIKLVADSKYKKLKIVIPA